MTSTKKIKIQTQSSAKKFLEFAGDYYSNYNFASELGISLSNLSQYYLRRVDHAPRLSTFGTSNGDF